MEFTSLKDASGRVGKILNLMGAVIEVGLCYKSNGEDYFYIVKIVDEGYPQGFPVRFFAADIDRIPSVNSVGDVLLVTNVMIEIKNSVKSVRVNVDKGYSGFAFFSGQLTGDNSYFHSRSRFFPAISSEHLSKSSNLKNWITKSPPNEGENRFLCLISDIKEGNSIDLICKVLHTRRESTNKWVLYVWDGTDLPTLNMEIIPMDNMEIQDLPEINTPTVGSILKIYITSERFDDHLLHDSLWVRLSRVTCNVTSSTWKGELDLTSKIRFIPDEDITVAQRIGNYNERLSYLSSSSAITSPSPALSDLHSDTQLLLEFQASSSTDEPKKKKPKRRSAKEKKRQSKKQRNRKKKQNEQNLLS